MLYLFSCICSLRSHFWKHLEAFSWTGSSLGPKSGKNGIVFITSLQNKEKCCGNTCTVLFSLPYFTLFPQPSIQYTDSLISQINQLDLLSLVAFLVSWMQICRDFYQDHCNFI